MFGDAPVDDAVITSAVEAHWGIECRELVYAPVGFGSFHWWLTTARGAQVFVTLDDLSAMPSADDRRRRRTDLEGAFSAAAALASAGHSFVRGPIPTSDGRASWSLGEARMLTLWPYVEGRSATQGDYDPDDDLRRGVLRLLARLHGTPVQVAPAIRAETFDVDNAEFLAEVAIGDLGRGWSSGPHGAAAKRLAREHRSAIAALLIHYRGLVAHAPSPSTWVITHGEPHAANVVATAAGPVLIDWDTALIAPRERDLWMVVCGRAEVDSAYANDDRIVLPVRQDMLRLYAAKWELTELGIYLQHFRGPHGDDADTEASWTDLQKYLPLEPRWPEL